MSGQKGSADPEGDAVVADLHLKFIGCYASEDQLPSVKEYGGGVYGANIAMAKQFAVDEKKRYLAIARAGVDGHNFAFDVPPMGKTVADSECEMPCADMASYKCGCSDASCGSLSPAKGEDNTRRWAVYEMPASKRKKKADKREGDGL
jgi:hypothetical protein